jgi:PS-10 peptidase S37
VAAPHRYFVLTYEQPADHTRPQGPKFNQRFTVLYRGTDRPTVLHTSGYNVSTSASRSEPTRLIDGNQISTEQRFFKPSRPEPADWRTLTIWQAATDHHRLVTALKPIFDRRWISTGASKGGMTSIYHRRFYPADVDATVAYVAPNDRINNEDSAYTEFFEEVGNDPVCRQALVDLQREALGPRRAELAQRFAAAAAANGWTFEDTIGTVDRALEVLVLDTAWAFWQYLGESSCPSVPSRSASTDAIYTFLDNVVSFAFYTDEGLDPYVPYYFQAGTELGYPVPDFGFLDGLTRYDDLYHPRSFVPAEIGMRFDSRRMMDVDRWVRQRGSELLFVYGENDPWGAEPFFVGPRPRDSYWYEAAGANHGANISRLTLAEQAEATLALQRWAGLAGTRSARSGGPAARWIASLDARNEALERRRP